MDCSRVSTAQPTISQPGTTKKAARLKPLLRRPRLHPNRKLKRKTEKLRREMAVAKTQRRVAKVVGIKPPAAPAPRGRAEKSRRRCCLQMSLTMFHYSIRAQCSNC